MSSFFVLYSERLVRRTELAFPQLKIAVCDLFSALNCWFFRSVKAIDSIRIYAGFSFKSTLRFFCFAQTREGGGGGEGAAGAAGGSNETTPSEFFVCWTPFFVDLKNAWKKEQMRIARSKYGLPLSVMHITGFKNWTVICDTVQYILNNLLNADCTQHRVPSRRFDSERSSSFRQLEAFASLRREKAASRNVFLESFLAISELICDSFALYL